jgi:hypothetical protein
MKNIIKNVLGSFGYEISKRNPQSESKRFTPLHASFNELDNKVIEEDFFAIYAICKKYTMTSIEKLYSLYCSVKYLIKNRIEGDFIECGVWKGGSAMLVALILK